MTSESTWALIGYGIAILSLVMATTPVAALVAVGGLVVASVSLGFAVVR